MRREFDQRTWWLVDGLVEEHDGGTGLLVGKFPREQLEEHAAHCVDVGCRGQPLGASLFRSHIGGGSHRRPGSRGGTGRGSDDPGDAEVGDLEDAVAREHHVLRLDVAMKDVFAMRVLEPG